MKFLNFPHDIINQIDIFPTREGNFFFLNTTFASLQFLRTYHNYLEIHLDGNEKPRKFYYLWLRDHCRCCECFNTQTHQISSDILELSNDIKPTVCEVDDTSLFITWNDGHKSEMSLAWLADTTFPIGHANPSRKIVFWDKNNVQSLTDSQISVEDYFEADGLKFLLNSLLKYGFCFVNGVKPTVEATEKAVTHLSFVQKTIFGEMFTVTNDNSRADTAYTPIGIKLHTDNTYFTEACGLQVFHMLECGATGGETILVDGFRAANKLKLKNKAAFDLLCDHPIESQFIEGKVHYSSIDPVIKLHPATREVQQIRFNIYDRTTLNTVPEDKILDYYDAYRSFGTEINNPDVVWSLKLQPGSLLILDNWRVMHGRNEYTGRRLFAGCYVARSDWLSIAKAHKLDIY